MGLASKHKKRLWYTAAVGGVASLTGLAGINYVARVGSPNSGAETPAAAAAAPQVARPMADAKSNKDKNKNKNSDSKGGKDATGDSGSYGKVVKVPCDPDELVQAILQANLDAGGTLKLAEHCTYTLTRSVNYDGLPPITQPVTILGNGATIQRAAGSAPNKPPPLVGTSPGSFFRIFDVEVGGNLKLSDLTVKYGVGTGIGVDSGGGGLLVRTGGRATVANSTFAFNRSTGVGGAISNFGITKITGDAKDGQMHKDGMYGSDDSESGDPYKSDSKDGAKDGLYGQWGQTPSSDDPEGGSEDGWSADSVKWGSNIVHNIAHDGLISLGAGGGGIFNQRLLTVENTRIAYNVASSIGSGGGLENVLGGVAQLRYVSVDHNHAADEGGGVNNSAGSTTTLEYSSVADNTSGRDGGGINNEQGVLIVPAGSVFLNYASVRHNFSGDDGGGVKNQGALVADRSRISENTADDTGGGLRNDDRGTAVLRYSEVNRNQTVNGNGAGIWNNALVNLTTTKVSENDADSNPAGGIQNSIGGTVNVDTHSAITKNVPTNCAPTSVTPPQACFN